MTGRPTLLTPELTSTVCQAISEDLQPLRFAAAKAGVHEQTLRAWVRAGERDIQAGKDTAHARFAMAIAAARAEKSHKLVARIFEIATTPSKVTGQCDAKPLMWLLERTEPRDFGASQKIEIETVEPGDPKGRLAGMIDGLAARAKPGGESE